MTVKKMSESPSLLITGQGCVLVELKGIGEWLSLSQEYWV